MQVANPATGAHRAGRLQRARPGVRRQVRPAPGRRGGAPIATGFDQLAAYGNAQDLATASAGSIDPNSDGVVNTANGDILTLQPVGGLPGSFNVVGRDSGRRQFRPQRRPTATRSACTTPARGPSITNHNFVIDPADTFITGTLLGPPDRRRLRRRRLRRPGGVQQQHVFFDMAFDGLGRRTSTASAPTRPAGSRRFDHLGLPRRARPTGGRRHGPGRHRRHRPVGAAHQRAGLPRRRRSGTSCCRTR